MSKKNSNVILKNALKNSQVLSETYSEFKNNLNNIRIKSCLIAISGGPDSLALAALAKLYNFEKKIKFHYVLVNHNIRKNSEKESKEVKKILRKNQINLNILTNTRKLRVTYRDKRERFDTK